MKKVLFLFLVSGSLFGNASVRAQSGTALGVKVGLNFLTAKVHFYDIPEEGGANAYFTYSGNSPQIGAAIQYNFARIAFIRFEGFSCSGDYIRTNSHPYPGERPQSVSITMPGIEFDAGVQIPVKDTTLSILGHLGFGYQIFSVTSSNGSIEDSWGGSKLLFNTGIGLRGNLSGNVFVEIELNYVAGLLMSYYQTAYTYWDVSMDGSRFTFGIFYKL